MPPASSLSLLPDVLRFPYPDHMGRPSTTRSAVLDNFGNAPATRRTLVMAGPDAGVFQLASQHPATRTLGPGDSELFTLRFAVPCGASPPIPGGSSGRTHEIRSLNPGGLIG